MIGYAEFIERKTQLGGQHGFEPVTMPDFLFPFQVDLVTWALRKGRAALFADCGLGKTPMQLVWADNVARHTGGRVLIVCPLAVSHQTVREGGKFDIDVARSDDGKPAGRITVTNYERLHHFDPANYEGTVCDESSAIKSFHGVRRELVTRFMLKQRYRLLCTATAAPNDYIELGTSSEALGELNRTDMLDRFFKNDDGTSLHARQKWIGQSGRTKVGWRFKGHAEEHFWRWVASWARALRKPSDLGYDNDGFELPPLRRNEYVVEARTLRPGTLFEMPATNFFEEREEERRTVAERCERAAALVNDTGEPAVVWCHRNDESRMLAGLIPDAVEVAGADSDDHKEQTVIDFLDGNVRVMVSKPRIFGWGLNLQHCAHMTFFPSHSYEAYYQAVRRCWRFGQTRPVRVDVIMTEGMRDVMANMKHKEEAADHMFDRLVAHMSDAVRIESGNAFTQREEIPAWLLQTNS